MLGRVRRAVPRSWSSPFPARWPRSPPSRRRPMPSCCARRPRRSRRCRSRARSLLPSPASYIREEQFQRGDTLTGFLSAARASTAARRELLARQRALQALRPGYARRAPRSSADGELVALSFLTGARHAGPDRRAKATSYRASEERAALETQRGDEVRRDPQLALRRDRRRRHPRQRRHAARRRLRRRHRLPPRPAQGRPLHRGVRAAPPRRPPGARRAACSPRSSSTRARRFRAVHYGNELLRARRQQPAQGVPARAARVLARELGLRHAHASRSRKAWRAHQGIDYAAPTGTRVRAVGDGVVEYAGPQGRLRQRGDPAPSRASTRTVYAHLSRIAVQRGARVAQNDTIGFVGQTGWATGPHLHYEFRIAGQARNPMSIAMPAALAGAGGRACRLPRPRRAAHRAPRAAGEQRPRAAANRKKKGPTAPFLGASDL